MLNLLAKPLFSTRCAFCFIAVTLWLTQLKLIPLSKAFSLMTGTVLVITFIVDAAFLGTPLNSTRVASLVLIISDSALGSIP